MACVTRFRCGLLIVRFEGLEAVEDVNAFLSVPSTMHTTYTLEDQP